jgi:PAS domain S-box-containing protein
MPPESIFPSRNPVGQTSAKLLARCLRLLHERTILVLTLLFSVGVVCMLWYVSRLQSDLVASTALQDASLYSQALGEVRTLYTSEVVDTALKRGIEVTHDHAIKDGAIPLPITFTMLIGKRIGEHGSGAQTRIYSPYPFPWRQHEGGLQDAFSREAWEALQRHPDTAYYRFEEINGVRSLRYATADPMRHGCVECHNTHPASPKTDWHEGDLRGVMEVILPLDRAMAQTSVGLRGTFALMGVMSVLGLIGLTVVIGRLRRSSADLTQRANALETEIGERQEVAEALRESEEKYRHIINAAADAIISIDAEGLVCEFNRAAEQIFGFSAGEMLGKPLTAIIPERLRDQHIAGLRRYLATGERRLPRWHNIELPGLTKGGREFPLEVSFSLLEAGEKKYLTGVLRDITERKRAEIDLQHTKEAAEAATQAKSEFLANMSHELRTPMNAIIGFTRLVMRRSKDILPPRDHENLGKILISAEHLLALINDILDLSKIEAGRMELHPVRLQLDGLVDACLRTVEPMLKSERLQLRKALAADLPLLFTDQDKLKQILMNLLSNAVKFTREGSVTVTARRHNSVVELAVVDTGIGIPEDKLELIFEEFRQVDSSIARTYGGTGLGLSISRRLARLLGGDLNVQSTVGVGSTFTVTIPLGADPAPSALCVTKPASGEPLPHVPDAGRVVLAIDDDPDVIYLLRENLAEAGYHVVGALTGQEGLRKALELRPLAITLDILMPQQDGWQVLHELKAEPETRAIPVVVLSIVDNKALGYRLGASDYLLKPFDRETILTALAQARPEQGRLLVVDDDPQVVDLIRQLLEGEPYEIIAVADGEAALEVISRWRPDAILLDLLMPRMDGFALIEQLEQAPLPQQIPVIVLTAKTLTANEQVILEQSVRTVIQKRGLDRETLIQELQGLLHVYRSAR